MTAGTLEWRHRDSLTRATGAWTRACVELQPALSIWALAHIMRLQNEGGGGRDGGSEGGGMGGRQTDRQRDREAERHRHTEQRRGCPPPSSRTHTHIRLHTRTHTHTRTLPNHLCWCAGNTTAHCCRYHVVGVYDGADLVVYVNGVEEGRQTIGAVVAYTGPEPLVIGSNKHTNHGSKGAIHAIIDEVGGFAGVAP